MKSKEIKRYNLPSDRVVTRTIDAKPYELLLVFVLIGMYITFYNQWYYGGIFTLLGFLILFILPKRVLVEFTNTYMILYSKVNSPDCMMVYYEEVASWIYHVGLYKDELQINLIDGTTQTVEGFSKFTFELEMNRYMGDKKIRK